MGSTSTNVLATLGTILFGAFLSFLVGLFWYRLNSARTAREKLQTEYVALMLRVDTLDKQLALVGHDVVPLSAAMQALLIKELTHFHTPKMDSLMAKLGPPSTLTDAEETELLLLLKEREIDMGDLISDSERDAAHILPAVIRRAKAEAIALAATQPTLQTVSIVSPVPPPDDAEGHA